MYGGKICYKDPDWQLLVDLNATIAEQDPLHGVSVFVAAARTGSFTFAADRRGITKSAVGKSMAGDCRFLRLDGLADSEIVMFEGRCHAGLVAATEAECRCALPPLGNSGTDLTHDVLGARGLQPKLSGKAKRDTKRRCIVRLIDGKAQHPVADIGRRWIHVIGW
jgi:hypothetical protein